MPPSLEVTESTMLPSAGVILRALSEPLPSAIEMSAVGEPDDDDSEEIAGLTSEAHHFQFMRREVSAPQAPLGYLMHPSVSPRDFSDSTTIISVSSSPTLEGENASVMQRSASSAGLSEVNMIQTSRLQGIEQRVQDVQLALSTIQTILSTSRTPLSNTYYVTASMSLALVGVLVWRSFIAQESDETSARILLGLVVGVSVIAFSCGRSQFRLPTELSYNHNDLAVISKAAGYINIEILEKPEPGFLRVVSSKLQTHAAELRSRAAVVQSVMAQVGNTVAEENESKEMILADNSNVRRCST